MENKNNKKAYMITSLILLVSLLIITISITTGQSNNTDLSDKDRITNKDIDRLFKPSYKKENIKIDAETLAPMKDEDIVTINVRDPKKYQLVEEIQIDEISDSESFIFDALNDLIALDIDDDGSGDIHEFVLPDEIGGYNFILVSYHQKLENKKGINCFYDVYFDGRRVGSTNQGNWYENYKFFAHNIEKSEEIEVTVKLKESSRLGGGWLDALNIYQPNYNEEEEENQPFIIVNDTDDKVAFLFIIWSSKHDMFVVDTGYLHKTRHKAFWRAIKNNFIKE